jgi:ribosomal-protein-alanine N-acetyltransferase
MGTTLQGSVGSLSARELRRSDIDLVAEYWATATPEHLIGMGVDLAKMPTRTDYIDLLTSQLDLALQDRQSYCTIWELDEKPIGHCNVNRISFGDQAYMHLHLWEPRIRHQGLGVSLVRSSLALFFGELNLRNLFCEPYAKNPAPNRVLEKVGFEFVATYRTVPGPINFEQDVNRWHMSRARYESFVQQGAWAL